VSESESEAVVRAEIFHPFEDEISQTEGSRAVVCSPQGAIKENLGP
jgi:AICAR transformylase/IMP cyclohydrolase PurH